MTRARALAAALAILLLAGCGFQLRGNAKLSLDTVTIGLPEADPLRRELAALLSANGVVVAPAAPENSRIIVQRNSLVRRVQSVGANARVSEFELVYDLAFSVTSPAGDERMNAQLNLSRDYSFDQAEVLGAAAEEEFLRAEMTREMASRMVRSMELKLR